jgi:hypothetical protein
MRITIDLGRMTRSAAALLALSALAPACQGDESSGGSTAVGWKIVPRRMYSAFDGTHSFKVPMLALNVFGVKWSISDPSLAHIDAYDDSDTAPGSEAMVLARTAGTTTISATAGRQEASSVLTVTAVTPQLWEIGRRRYVEGALIRNDVPDPAAACTNCHGAGKNDVEHTPAQIGGFSDEDVIAIFTEGRKPPGVKNRVIPFEQWSPIHRWAMDDEEKKGVVAYLRSLEPQSQGTADFAGEGVFER